MKINFPFFSILILSFSSGLPLLLSSTTLQAWYTVQGVSIHTIGLLSLVGIPYLLKLFWAPLIDRFYSKKIGRRRTWIFAMQCMIAVILICMSAQQFSFNAKTLALLAVLLAFFSATQDTAIDAYRTEILTPAQYGWGSAYNTFGYYTGMVLSGGVALIIAALWNWGTTYFSFALLFIALCTTTFFLSPEPSSEKPKALSEASFAPFQDFFSRKNAVLIIFFIVLYKLSDELSFSLNSYFLLHTLQFSLVVVGAVSKFAWMGSVLLGTLVGGFLYARLKLYRALLFFGAFQLLSIWLWVALSFIGKNLTLMVIATVAEKFATGLTNVAFVAFLMSLCNVRYTAVQFAFFSALAALSRILVGPLAALFVTHWGWVDFYAVCFLVGLPALFLLPWIFSHATTRDQ